MTYIYSGRKPIAEDSSDSQLQSTDELSGELMVGVIQVQGGGQLPFQLVGHLRHFLLGLTPDNQRTGAKNLLGQRGGVHEFGRGCLIQLCLALVRAFRRQASCIRVVPAWRSSDAT